MNGATTYDWIVLGSAILQGLGTLVALVALAQAQYATRKQLVADSYSEIDGMYRELLTVAIADPRLCVPALHLGDPEFAAKYDLYAFMVWNFIETIQDRCSNSRRQRAIWQPCIEYEGLLHRDWFNNLENRRRFKPMLVDFVNAGGFAEKRKPTRLRGAFRELVAV